jgi:hypothetical protein
MPTFNSEEYLVKKVGGYARVSTFEQAEKGTSIYEQKRLIIEECLKRGWQLVKIYCDEGVSGRMTHRQGLSELQRDAQMGLFQIIMFTKSDRIARSIRDLSNLWHDWTEWGLEIICVENRKSIQMESMARCCEISWESSLNGKGISSSNGQLAAAWRGGEILNRLWVPYPMATNLTGIIERLFCIPRKR